MAQQQDRSPAMRSAIAGVIDQIKAEQRWLVLMRLVCGAAFLSWFLFFTWATPWSPIAMMAPDYSAFGALGFIFAISALFATVAYWMLWRPTLKNESTMEFVHVLFGAGLLLRRPSQFKSRLGSECRRSRSHAGSTFSLIALDLPEAQEEPEQRGPQREWEESLFAIAVRSIARSGDMVAEVSPREAWVLAFGADADILPTIVHRMASAFSDPTTSLPKFRSVRIGGAAVGPARSTPKELFAAAREELAPANKVTKLSPAA